MKIEKRIKLIRLLSEELCDTATEFAIERTKNSYPTRGYGDITADNCRTALKRRIVTLRAELLELSKTIE